MKLKQLRLGGFGRLGQLFAYIIRLQVFVARDQPNVAQHLAFLPNRDRHPLAQPDLVDRRNEEGRFAFHQLRDYAFPPQRLHDFIGHSFADDGRDARRVRLSLMGAVGD
ncbi:hypothetical protein [Cohnella rhizosphaerae]|uniref:Uncharacterized protein n=1 Tax=Cohnella rhizosphaerae TaxID=1457232 RepID=A0A9X4L3A7_9BACL|nr:hypothetical protein [Cohnella rhizosphaerae]MDG0812677.1 hypothetical protein [Cohnella rhizosphaerae]